MPLFATLSPEQLTALRERILAHFNLEELRLLVADLGENYDDLRGETISGKIQALLEHLNRRDRLPDLIARLQELRPVEEWANILPAEPNATSPYKGLLYFDEADAPLFFGREQVTAELLAHLRQHRFLAVVGASGSGKSSVVRAGVIPAIRRGEIASEQGSSAAWPVHLITPGDEPLKALAATLTRDSESVTATKTLLADLQTDTDSLDLVLYRQIGASNGRCLLIVDQFEELFTQCRDAAAREMFVGNLVTAVTSGQQARLSLLLTLRADFYAQAVQLEALRPLLETRQKIIGAMTPNELRQAIEGPAAKSNWALQPGLVETMLQDAGREPGALPLLSHALQETWARREGRTLTLAGYQEAGGVRRAIAQTADAVYASLTPEQQSMARNIFLRLTELGEGTEDTRRRVALAELLPEGEGETAVLDLLDLLARRRLVTLNRETAHAHAEVAHEALIREWPALRDWLDENREGLRLHRQLTEAAGAWEAHGEDESYLYRGGRLAQAREWALQAEAQLNALELRFLTASQEHFDQEAAEREAQQRRELAQAQQLAEAQTLRAKTIRQALIDVSMVLVLAVAAAIFGFVQSSIATDNANLAATREAEAERQARLALAQSVAVLSPLVYQRTADPKLATLLAVEAHNMNRDEGGHLDWLTDGGLRPLLAHAPPYFNNILEGHESWVLSVAFSPDGQTLASGSADRPIRLWDLGEPTAAPVVLSGHKDGVLSVAFSPDGQTLASGSADRTIRLWDLGEPTAAPVVLSGHEYGVLSVAFSPDGQTLASGSDDSTIRLWILLDGLVEIGCQKVWRNLSWQEWQQYLPGEPYRQTCPNLPPHPSVPEGERPTPTHNPAIPHPR